MEFLQTLGIIVGLILLAWGGVKLLSHTKKQRFSSTLQAVLPETRHAKRNK